MIVSANKYLSALFILLLAVAVPFARWGLSGRDHFAAISSDHGPTWYQDIGGDAVTEIQDQDLFFHNIGGSLDHLRNADVVIVGSSLVSFAINGAIARERLGAHGLKFYNLAFVGISSGEFTRRIIEKFNIRPKLWIINADDGGGGGNFFGTNIQRSFSGDVKVIAATEHGPIAGYREVMRRNLRWRSEALFRFLRSSLPGSPPDSPVARFFRDAATGDGDLSAFPAYDRDDNPPAAIKQRDSECHTNEAVIQIARKFIATIHTEAVLTLVPNTYYCEQQAREVADELGIELVLTKKLTYSSWDGGGHLDRLGSKEFTSDLMTALEKSATFHRITNTANDS
jgi:hypothetical protein